ncbi:MAG: DUF4352 domain-containing protein [Coriobacteriia bacterium]|nr:DUF4352 domain-containing protein [Coriobacteriia bacterium]MCL2537324.1 DUF4352 domain-containing protein [Coriobacteriia bacterium]
MKKLLLFVLVLSLSAFMLVGCDDTTPTVVDTADAEATAPAEDTSSGVQTFQIGDTVELKDFRVTVNSVRTDMGSDMMEPDAGNEYFYVDVTIENISDSEQTVSSVMMFSVRDQQGVTMDQAIFADTKGSLDGTVLPGKMMTGEYAVEVPEGTTGLELQFDGAFLSGGSIIIDLN